MPDKSRNVRTVTIKEKKLAKRVQKEPAKANHGFFERPLFLILFIVVITFIAFVPTLKNDFIPTWDDDVYIIENVMIRHLDMQSTRQ
jgi:hypothetical protein